MENQINISDQNTQQIGQNNIDLSTKNSQKPKTNLWLYFSLALIFLLIIVVGLMFIVKSKKSVPATTVNNPNQISNTLTSPSPTELTKMSPIYSAEEYVVFAHYNLGYTIEYPATNVDMHLVGATGGNFTQKYKDGSSILIYDIYPESNAVSGINIDNLMQQLTECGEGGCGKFFEYKDYEKLQEKKVLSLKGNTAYWIKTIIPEGSTNKLPPHVPIESATIERYFIPQKSRFLIIELIYKNRITNELTKAVDSFKLIPIVPPTWIEYKNNENSKIRFKYPNDYKLTEDIQKKEIGITSSQGTIIINYLGKNDEISKYFNYQSHSDFPYLSLESGYSAEEYLGNDIAKLKFSINAFTFRQGGDTGIRVLDENKQQVTVYFYTTGSSLTYRISAPKNMETIMDQILLSVNELMR